MVLDETVVTVDAPAAFINRELSWLAFARRVLALAEDPREALLERVKFAGIMGMIYDEFAMKRIGGLRRQIEKKKSKPGPDGMMPAEELAACRAELRAQARMVGRLLERELRPALAAAGLPILDAGDLDESQRTWLRTFFEESIDPILTPLAVDAAHPFPFISNLGLNLAVQVRESGRPRDRFVRIKVPPNRSRWVKLPGGEAIVPLEQVIALNLPAMFPAASEVRCSFFRVTRGAKDDPWTELEGEEETDFSPGAAARHGHRGADRAQVRRRRPPAGERRHARRPAGLDRRPARGGSRGHRADRGPARARRPDEAAGRGARRAARRAARAGHSSPAARPRPGGPGGDLRRDPARRPARPRALPELRHLGAAFPRERGGGPAGAGDQAHHLPHQQPLADHPGAGRGRPARQAGRGAGRDHRALRRGAEHRLGPAPRAGRRARRLRRRAPEDPRQARAGGARGARRHPPLRPRRHRQLPHRHGPALRGPRRPDRGSRRSPPRSARCSTS